MQHFSQWKTFREPNPSPENQYTNTYLSTCVFQESDILRAINKKINKTPGPNKISQRIIKGAKSELVKPLSALCYKSLISGKVPCEWKQANVTPLKKTVRFILEIFYS